jgi:glycosyltransferase involved in cell wall biosynthesis
VSVTVVVPTCNRRAWADELVSALQAQTWEDLRFVVVDDGSVDGTEDAWRAAAAGDDRFRFARTDRGGPAVARNAALGELTTEWVAFTDDDCLPTPGWVEALVRRATESGATVVQGLTRPHPAVDRTRLPWWSRSMTITSWSGRFQTCNLLVRREALLAVGGFDVRFPHFGEDTDLGLRLVARGEGVAFAPDAVVHHRIIPMTYREFLRRRYRWAQVVQLVAVNPDARRVFPMRYVAYRLHLVFWLGIPVVGWSVANRRPWLPVVLAVALGHRQARRSPSKGRSVPVATLYGTAELGGVAASAIGFLVQSLRHRRVLL